MIADFREGRAFEEAFHIKVDGKEARHDRPLHLEKILAKRAVEGAFISRAQIGSLLRGRKLNIRDVTQRLQRFSGAREVRGPEQDIEIIELAQGKIAVNSFSQHRSLVRNRVDCVRFKAIENTNQFADENQIASRVVLIALAQFILNRRRDPFRHIA